jgi:hypothetical protein
MTTDRIQALSRNTRYRTCVIYTAVIIGFLISLGVTSGRAEFRSPRMAALGGAGRATPLLNDAIYLNPSFASLLPVYSWSVNFRNLEEGRAYNASVLDGRSELFQAGLAYQVRDTYSSVHFGASSRVHPQLTAGVGLKLYFSKDRDAFEGFREFSLSSTYTPFDWLQLAAIAENLDQSPELGQLAMSRELVLAARIRLAETLTVYLDPHVALRDTMVPRVLAREMGAEIALFKDFYFRLGTFSNSTVVDLARRSDGFGYGFGWLSPKISFDFAVDHVTAPITEVTHSSGLTLYF